MLAPTHSVFGLFLTLTILAVFGVKVSLHWSILGFAIMGAIIPDIDYPKSMIGKLFPFISSNLERKFGHRTFTHSLLGALVFTGIFAMLIVFCNLSFLMLHFVFGFKYLGLRIFDFGQWTSDIGLVIRWIAAFGLSFLSHLMLDMFNKQGTQLLWPNTGRDVMPKNDKLRLESGSRAEVYVFLGLLGILFLALPISKYGIGSSLHWILATPQSEITEYMNLKNHTTIEFKGEFQANRERVEGIAEILDVVNNQLIIRLIQISATNAKPSNQNKSSTDFGRRTSDIGRIYTLGTKYGADILATKVQVHYRGTSLKFRQVVFKEKTREELLAQISAVSLFSGYLELPTDMLLKFPADIKQPSFQTMSQKGNNLLLNFASLAQLEKLGLNEQFQLLRQQDKRLLIDLRVKKKKLLQALKTLKIQESVSKGLGGKAARNTGKNSELERKIAVFRSQLSEIDMKLQAINLRKGVHEFLYTGEVKVRE